MPTTEHVCSPKECLQEKKSSKKNDKAWRDGRKKVERVKPENAIMAERPCESADDRDQHMMI